MSVEGIILYMRKNKVILIRRISFVSAIAVIGLIPTYIWFIPPFMILWGITWILDLRETKKVATWEKYRNPIILFALFMGFYLWQFAGISYSAEKSTGWRFFLSRLSLFLFPLVLTIPGEKIKSSVVKLLRIFAACTTIFILICFGYAFFRSINLINGHFIFDPNPPEAKWFSYFYSYYFSINQHPSYLSVYVMLSVFIALESWFDKLLKTSLRIIWLFSAFLLMLSVYFLSSRTGIILLLALVPVYILIRLRGKSKIITIATLILVSLLAAIVTIKTNTRVNYIYSGIKSGTFKQVAVKDGRITIWEAALNPIKKNLIFGVGTGGVDSVMEKEYLKIGNEEMVKGKYNIHNQFLEILLENGLIGLILFISMIGFMIYITIEHRNLLYGIFILIMLVFFSFETVLNRLQGVSYFSLFSFLLIHVNTTSPEHANLEM